MNNTIFVIKDKKGNKVGTHTQNPMCKTHWADLLVFEPLKDFTITPQGYHDDDDEFWIGGSRNLREFLIECHKTTCNYLVKVKGLDLEKLIKNNSFYYKDSEEKNEKMIQFLKEVYHL